MDDLTSVITPRSLVTITEAERARRKAAIDYARGSVRLEGFVAQRRSRGDLNRLYVEGEITLAQHSAAIRKRHGL